MLQRVVKQIPLFESLELFTEAPKKKKNIEVITARPPKQDYTDFINDEEINIDDDPDDLSDYSSYLDDDGDIDPGFDPEETEDYAPDDDSTGVQDNNSDVGTGEETPAQQPTQTIDATQEDNDGADPEASDDLGADTDTPSPEEQNTEPIQDTEQETNGEQQETPPAEETPPEEGGNDTAEVIDGTGDDDPGADPEASGDLGADAATNPEETPPAEDPNQAGNGQSATKDDMRKFELFNRTLNLYNAILYMIDKLGVTVTDDRKFGYAVKQSLFKLKSYEGLLKDYMLLKFQSDSYFQNSFFYEQIKACTMEILEFMRKNKNTEKEK